MKNLEIKHNLLSVAIGMTIFAFLAGFVLKDGHKGLFLSFEPWAIAVFHLVVVLIVGIYFKTNRKKEVVIFFGSTRVILGAFFWVVALGLNGLILLEATLNPILWGPIVLVEALLANQLPARIIK